MAAIGKAQTVTLKRGSIELPKLIHYTKQLGNETHRSIKQDHNLANN